MVTLVGSAILKNPYYDRNQTAIGTSAGSQAIAPHATTTRTTYTVPTARKAIITSGYSKVQRITVAAPPGIAQSFVGDLAGRSFSNAGIDSLNTVGDKDNGSGHYGSVAGAGSTINILDGDLSTGGTVSFL